MAFFTPDRRSDPSALSFFVAWFSRRHILTCLLLRNVPDMRRDVQEIFRMTPHHKQVMMFSATLSKEIRGTCKKFMTNVSHS
jgi:hypothetical protein